MTPNRVGSHVRVGDRNVAASGCQEKVYRGRIQIHQWLTRSDFDDFEIFGRMSDAKLDRPDRGLCIVQNESHQKLIPDPQAAQR
jgi:hypothetical protein